jgi:hypothetical protein
MTTQQLSKGTCTMTTQQLSKGTCKRIIMIINTCHFASRIQYWEQDDSYRNTESLKGIQLSEIFLLKKVNFHLIFIDHTIYLVSLRCYFYFYMHILISLQTDNDTFITLGVRVSECVTTLGVKRYTYFTIRYVSQYFTTIRLFSILYTSSKNKT